uniref:Uncharacterized protein n=1 Tax=Guillardia theta TaxID=55529 RepID=A0A7S4N7W1_GUITH
MMYKEETLAESLSAVVVDEFSFPTAAAVSACFLLPYVLRLLGLAVISMTKNTRMKESKMKETKKDVAGSKQPAAASSSLSIRFLSYLFQRAAPADGDKQIKQDTKKKPVARKEGEKVKQPAAPAAPAPAPAAPAAALASMAMRVSSPSKEGQKVVSSSSAPTEGTRREGGGARQQTVRQEGKTKVRSDKDEEGTASFMLNLKSRGPQTSFTVRIPSA